MMHHPTQKYFRLIARIWSGFKLTIYKLVWRRPKILVASILMLWVNDRIKFCWFFAWKDAKTLTMIFTFQLRKMSTARTSYDVQRFGLRHCLHNDLSINLLSPSLNTLKKLFQSLIVNEMQQIIWYNDLR